MDDDASRARDLLQDIRKALDDEPGEGFHDAVVQMLLARLIVAVERLRRTLEEEGTATRSELQSRR